MDKLFDNRTRALVINSPANPTGAVYSSHYLSQLIDICDQHKVPIISDEIYEHMVRAEKSLNRSCSEVLYFFYHLIESCSVEKRIIEHGNMKAVMSSFCDGKYPSSGTSLGHRRLRLFLFRYAPVPVMTGELGTKRFGYPVSLVPS